MVRPRSLVIEERVIDNVFSTDCAAQAPHTERPTLTSNRSTWQQGNKGQKASPQSAQCKLNTAIAEEAQQNSATTEYTVDRIVSHVGTCGNIWYVVRMYGSTAGNDIIKPAE